MIAPWLAAARAELARNPRLRLGIVLVGALLMIYQLTGLSATRDHLSADYATQWVRLQRVQNISKEDGWDRRASDIHTIRKGLEAEIPDADTVGLAQATVQGWLRDTTNSVGPKLSITMGTPVQVNDAQPYWKVPAQIGGMVRPAQALQLIRQIESRKELMVIQSIRLTTGSSPSIALEVASYYRVNRKAGDHADP